MGIENLFFAIGYNKSGTTYLQQLLDGHPKANCPPEHHLISVTENIKKFSAEYQGVIKMFDDRTAKQGLRFNEKNVYRHALRAYITAFVTDGAKSGTTHFGLNDNSMWKELPYYARLFEQAKFVAIVRDPRAVALSLHSHRLRTEPEYAASGITLSQVAGGVGAAWFNTMQAYDQFCKRPALAARFHRVRYEDLAGPDKAETLQGIYDFLGLETDAKTLQKVLDANDFEKKKSTSKDGASFLNAGTSAKWQTALSPADLTAIRATSGKYMKVLGYL